MFVTLLILSFTCCLQGRPTKDLILGYARKHPNTDAYNGEFGDLFQGDIILSDRRQMREVGGPMNIMPDKRYRWPDKTLFYEIMPDGFTETQIEEIEDGIRDLVVSTKVNGQTCIQLIPRTDEVNYVFVVKSSGCSSAMGMVGGSQRLTMADGCFRHGTIMHEFLHALGYYHEQSRADRDEYVFVNYDNIEEGMAFNFDKLKEGEEIDHLGSPYDYGSVMHYPAWGFAIDPEIPTLIPLDPDAEIGQRTHLSEVDIERVQIAYNCLSPRDSKHFKHLAA